MIFQSLCGSTAGVVWGLPFRADLLFSLFCSVFRGMWNLLKTWQCSQVCLAAFQDVALCVFVSRLIVQQSDLMCIRTFEVYYSLHKVAMKKLYCCRLLSAPPFVQMFPLLITPVRLARIFSDARVF